MNKRLVTVIVTVTLAAAIILVTLIFSPLGKDNDVSSKPSNSVPAGTSNGSQSMEGATGDILSGEKLESFTDAWNDFVESTQQNNNLELEVVPNSPKPSKPSSGGTTATKPSTTTSNVTTSNTTTSKVTTSNSTTSNVTSSNVTTSNTTSVAPSTSVEQPSSSSVESSSKPTESTSSSTPTSSTTNSSKPSNNLDDGWIPGDY